MEIHQPEGPTRSFREFLIHIGIVTIGILIALGLESVEEAFHYRHVVREARENFYVELEGNREHMNLELANDTKLLKQLDEILADLPQLRQQPTVLTQRVQQLFPSGYFFISSRWEAALSSGAISHMDVDHINRYSEVNFMVHTYTGLQNISNDHWDELEAFFNAHQNPSPAELSQGIEKIYLFRSDVRSLKQGAQELSGAIDDALKLK